MHRIFPFSNTLLFTLVLRLTEPNPWLILRTIEHKYSHTCIYSAKHVYNIMSTCIKATNCPYIMYDELSESIASGLIYLRPIHLERPKIYIVHQGIHVKV